ncbi:MAG: energy transducer TonB, partial [Helicobacteraceae bacterium]|jgi:protein TonB|nr:energy transducer TonB [Helicobacteraceae bacterium]
MDFGDLMKIVKEEVVEDPVEEVEEELVEIVDEKTPVDAVDDEEAKEVVVMPEMPAVLSPAGQQAIDAPPAEVMSPEDAYVKAHIAEIMALLRKNLYYPRMARKRGIEGTVIVRFELLASGKVKNIIIVEASRKILGQAAVTTIKRLNGKFPLPSERLFLNVPIMYRLR